MTITDLRIELPDSLSGDEARVLLAVKLYELGKASLGQAARMAGYSKRAFIEVLGHHRVAVFNSSPEDLEREIGL